MRDKKTKPPWESSLCHITEHQKPAKCLMGLLKPHLMGQPGEVVVVAWIPQVARRMQGRTPQL